MNTDAPDIGAWLFILGTALLFVGALAFRINGMPRRLRPGPRKSTGPTALSIDERGLRWLDQFSFMVLTILVIGMALLLASLWRWAGGP